MKTFEKLIKIAKLLERKAEATDTFEITNTKCMSRTDAEKTIDLHYIVNSYDKLTYKGHQFFDKVYMDKINTFAHNELGIGKSYTYKETDDEGEEYDEEARIDGQESYLGYLPDKDIFVSGWDMFGDAGDECVVFMKIDNNLNVTLVDTGKSYEGMMYGHGPRGSNLEKLHRDFPTLTDIRLD